MKNLKLIDLSMIIGNIQATVVITPFPTYDKVCTGFGIMD